MEKHPAIEQWKDYKFGMFLHYGLYSIHGKGEWAMFYEPIDKDEYAKLGMSFTAENFDAAHICELAKKAGMRYTVLTSRHHDGFCLFDSKHSIGEFTVMNTPAKRDLIREYTDACHASGIGCGIYYSPMDWRCEGFFFPQMYHRSAMQMRTQCHCQVRELLSNYGKIDILWYDGGEDHWLAHGRHYNDKKNDRPADFVTNPLIRGFWGEEEVDAFTRELQPEIMVSNRFGLRKSGDFFTPERRVGNFDPVTPWETCDTLSESWGWTKDAKLRSKTDVIHLLINVVTGGGNLLLNVSPMADASIQPEHEQRLLEVGEWVNRYTEAIHGTRGGPVKNDPEIGGATCRENFVYFFVKTPACTQVSLPIPDGVSVNETKALTGESVSAERENGVLRITIPADGRDECASVIRVALDKPVSEAYRDFDPETFDAFH